MIWNFAWAYSKPVVVLDMIWNFAFVVVAAVVLVLSRNETPSVPLRLWMLGYAFECPLHMVCVMVEFWRRVRSRGQVCLVEEGLGKGSIGEIAGSSVEGNAGSQYVTLPQLGEEGNSIWNLPIQCVCSFYDDGVELHELPCNHHFHSACVDKWLFINATCPLCKYNILKNSNHDHEEV